MPLNGVPTNLRVEFYDYHFQPAIPPMSGGVSSDSSRFEADNSFMIVTGDTLKLDKQGLYYFAIQGAKEGKSVIVTDPQYPGTNSFEELVNNLRYLTTEDEWEKLSTSFNKKDMFDKFWLNNTMSEDKAKASIREYYRRVRAANEYFTSYKEGWKTDRGMIFIAFGPPTRVFIQDDSEMWIYEKTFELPRVAFTFTRIDTAFTDKHFVLIRKAEYQNLWFRVVDLWRKGKKEF